jgi:tRNA A-37 threonylcarbamoyl transferase component Bud32
MFQPLPGEFAGTSRFRVEDRLGSGAFGVVYRAFDAERGQAIALKLLNEAEADPLYRFKREFRQLANVRHPNLVTFHELISDGSRWFLVMELVEGVNFLEYVRGDRPDDAELPYNPERLFGTVRQLAVGLSALHAAGILHRDVKPSNVLVTKDGHVKILDFGLATDLASHGMSASLSSLGTPTYVAPEQALGLATTTAADWYSMGVMLFEALAGRPPFTGKVLEVMVKKQTAEAPAATTLVPGVPENLDRLCAGLLRRDPRERTTGVEILRELGGADIPAMPALAPTRGVSAFVGRHAELAALTAAYQESVPGRAVLALMRGGSGVGKTALARRFLDAFSVFEPRALVLRGRCYDRESMPFKAVDSLIDAVSGYLKSRPGSEVRNLLPRDVHALARLFPVLRQVHTVANTSVAAPARDSGEVRRRAAVALRELFANIAGRRPLALFVDDLHWGDADSAPLLAEILRPPDAPRLLFVAAYRAEEADTSPFLHAFLPLVDECEVVARVVTVGELSASSAR